MGRTGGRICRLGNAKPGTIESSSDNDVLPENALLKRIKPRLGSQYQTKVAKFEPVGENDIFIRPLPDQMSVDHPHLTIQEAQDTSGKHIDLHPSVFSISSGHETTRGGACVHKAGSKQVDEYLMQAQHLTHPDLAKPPKYQANEGWKQEMIRQTATGGRRGRKKRTLQNASWTNSTAPSQEKEDRVVLEDQECILQYLQSRHKGNVGQAELSMRVHLPYGKASKARKCLRNILHDNRFKRPSFESSQSWRSRWERTFSAMLGDYREDPCFTAYPHIVTSTEPNIQQQQDDVVMEDFDEDMRGVWRSVLSCGQEMERALNGNEEPLEMRKVVDFLRNAFSLPTVESSFGNRHLVVQSVSECFNSIFDHLSKARDYQAKVHDVLFDGAQEGVDMEVLKKMLDESSQKCRIRIEDYELLRIQIEATSDWQARLDTLLTLNEDTMEADNSDNLKAAEGLANEARTLGVYTRNLLLLEKRLQKASELQQRLEVWRHSQAEDRKENIKFLTGLVRDANRISLPSKEVWELLRFNRELEIWTDRANIAIRSRISLLEIESLMQRADAFPLDLSDTVEKLNSRVRMAREWLDLLKLEVPCPMVDGKVDRIAWMMQMRNALKDDTKGGAFSRLHELVSEGTRVSVEIDAVKMLQVELEAKNWSTKARKWLPREGATGDDAANKKGKLEDLREHLMKAAALRDKLVIAEKKDWVLDGELELVQIVASADRWLDAYFKYLECDNRRNEDRSCLSIATLRNIVNEGNTIHANLGTGMTKMARVLAQADAWYQKYSSLYERALDGEDRVVHECTLAELNEAVSVAAKEVSLDLDEALAIKDIAKRAQQWMDRVLLVAPKRSKRKGVQHRFNIDDLMQLVSESKTLPINTSDYVSRLNVQLAHNTEWRMHALGAFADIAKGFERLRVGIDGAYGQPEEFFSAVLNKVTDMGDTSMCTLDDNGVVEARVASPDSEPVGISSSSDQGESESHVSQNDVSVEASDNIDIWSRIGADGQELFKLIHKLVGEAKLTWIHTPEEEMTDHLETISKWCVKSLHFVNCPNVTFEKRNVAQFDKFIINGTELLGQREFLRREVKLDDEVFEKFIAGWATVVENQLTRLRNLQAFRDKFIAWCKEAQQVILGKDKRPSIEVLSQLAIQSFEFPSCSEVVQKVRTLSRRANKWISNAVKALDSLKKITIKEAKDLVDEGERLKINCNELKFLRNAIRSARGWLNRVKRSKFDQGETSSSDIEELIDEHDALDLSLPDEVQKLKQAMTGYCICRRPYEGFMIGCDSCEEWYHGTCIGVSEAQAERFDKYVCVRCSVQKTFHGSAHLVASVIRKWTGTKDLKKARQNEYQKHQRKVRKEKKDIEKLESELEIYRNNLLSLDSCQFSYVKPSSHESVNSMNGQAHPATLQERNNGTNEAERCTINANNPHEVKNTENLSQSDLAWRREHDDEMSALAPVDEAVHHMDEGARESGSEGDQNALTTQIGKITLAIKMCHERLRKLSQIASDRNDLEREEDNCRPAMFRWCVRIRSIILVPSNVALAEASRPETDGSMSSSMLTAFRDAEDLQIARLPDVHLVANAFRCLAWSALAMEALARKPSFVDVSDLISRCSSLSLPDEKAVRTLKAMLQRTILWQLKARKVLTPVSEETKPFNMEMLRNLQDTESEVPLEVPEMEMVSCTIQDKGRRHCICGGPNDGTFMLGCDKCGRWFHGRCIEIPNRIGCQLDEWMCQTCGGNVPDVSSSHATSEVIVEEENSSKNEIIPHAPTISKLWPPFGFLNSPESIAALGEDCCNIPDDSAPLVLPCSVVSNLELAQCANNSLQPEIAPTKSSIFFSSEELPNVQEGNDSSRKLAVGSHENSSLYPPGSLATNKITPLNSPGIFELATTAMLALKEVEDTQWPLTLGDQTTANVRKSTRDDNDGVRIQCEGASIPTRQESHALDSTANLRKRTRDDNDEVRHHCEGELMSTRQGSTALDSHGSVLQVDYRSPVGTKKSQDDVDISRSPAFSSPTKFVISTSNGIFHPGVLICTDDRHLSIGTEAEMGGTRVPETKSCQDFIHEKKVGAETKPEIEIITKFVGETKHGTARKTLILEGVNETESACVEWNGLQATVSDVTEKTNVHILPLSSEMNARNTVDIRKVPCTVATSESLPEEMESQDIVSRIVSDALICEISLLNIDPVVALPRDHAVTLEPITAILQPRICNAEITTPEESSSQSANLFIPCETCTRDRHTQISHSNESMVTN